MIYHHRNIINEHEDIYHHYKNICYLGIIQFLVVFYFSQAQSDITFCQHFYYDKLNIRKKQNVFSFSTNFF